MMDTNIICEKNRAMRGLLPAHGQACHMADMRIAATAQFHALTLVTRNVRDFDGCGIAVFNPFSE